MGVTVDMTNGLICLLAATGWTGTVQDIEDWLNTLRYKLATVLMEVPYVSGCTVYLEGCDQSGGSFTIHKGIDTPCYTVVNLNRLAPFGTEERLNALMRWRVVGPGTAAWKACFRMTSVFK